MERYFMLGNKDHQFFDITAAAYVRNFFLNHLLVDILYLQPIVLEENGKWTAWSRYGKTRKRYESF